MPLLLISVTKHSIGACAQAVGMSGWHEGSKSLQFTRHYLLVASFSLGWVMRYASVSILEQISHLDKKVNL